MVRRLLIAITLLPFAAFSQGVEIKVKVLQSLSAQAKLFIYQGSQVVQVDSAWQQAPGTYHFKSEKGYEQGLYRVSVGKSVSFNVVVANEPLIDIKTVVYAPEDSLSSSNSIENRIYWQYQKEKRRVSQHTWLLRSLIDLYPDSAMFRQKLLGELYRQEVELFVLAKRLIAENPTLLSTKFIAVEQRPVSPPFIEADITRQYLMESWWDGVDLNDMRIVSTPEFSKYLWAYVEILFGENFDKEQQDENFIKGIEKLMNLSMSPEMKPLLRSQLIEGFVDSDYQIVIEYLKTKSFGELQALIAPKDYWKQQNETPLLRVGSKAFDFNIKNAKGKSQKISKLKSEYILIVFWSTWCPHCIETLPRIADVYTKYNRNELEVIAICIDEDDNHYQEYVSKLKLNWINLYEPNTGNSKLLNMYDVNETPKMFLLSKDLVIVSKPSTRKQLELKLKHLLR
jgi:peroxiredoxin